MNAAIATPIAPVTAEIATAPAKITDWTEADFRAQVNVFVHSQKEFVNGVTRCTLYAVRAAMMNSNNQRQPLGKAPPGVDGLAVLLRALRLVRGEGRQLYHA